MRCSLTNQQAEVLKNLVDKEKEYSLAELEGIYEENNSFTQNKVSQNNNFTQNQPTPELKTSQNDKQNQEPVSSPISNDQPKTPYSGEIDTS
jgi:DNA replication initiation complex subunit (GINS family)